MLTSCQFTSNVHFEVLHEIKHQMYKFLLSSFQFANQNLELSLIEKSLVVTKLKKFEVIGLLHFPKRTLLSHVAGFPV